MSQTAGPQAPRLSIVIPALNEEEGIGDVLDAIPLKALEEAGWPAEVIVVDGESVDRTRDIAEARGARVVIEPRKGYGRAYKTGFEFARGEVIATADADATYPLDRLLDYLRVFEREELDFATGDRFAKLEAGAMSPKHKLGNAILSATMRLLFLVPVRDSQSGMWILRRDVLPRLRLTSDGMPLSEEIKIEAFTREVIRAKEIPIEYRLRLGSVKLSSWRDGWANLRFLMKKRFGLAEPDS